MKPFDENDRFWSLDSMLPPSAFTKKTVNTDYDTESVEIEIEGEEKSAPIRVPQREKEYPPLNGGAKIDFGEWLRKREQYKNETQAVNKVVENEYVPDNPLIYSVKIVSVPSKRRQRERFLTDAERLFGENAAFNGNEPYHAIFPQYASMSENQLACYIGFRTCVRQGVFPQVDESYILLLAYELINLTETISPDSRAETLASLICAYPDMSDKLFAELCNYLADVCLIYKLPIPEKIFGQCYPRVLKSARIKEVFVKNANGSEACSLLASAGRYDYRTSKFYGENKALYDNYIEKAVALAIEHIARTDSRFRDDKKDACRLEHESFFGAYRTDGAKKHIIMELACLTRDDEVKRTVSELAKYAENCLRSALGIKPRLTVSYVNREIKNVIKIFIAENTVSIAPVTRKTEKTAAIPEVPDYEKMYEPRRKEFSFEDAERIEESSWSVTEKQVAAFDENAEETPFIAPVTENKAEIPHENEDPLMRGLAAIVNGNMRELGEAAREGGMLTDALVDKINELMLEKIGDIAIERTENGYAVAEWYVEDVSAMLEENN